MPLQDDKSDFKVLLAEELRSGLWPTQFDTIVPFWETAENVTFTPTGLKKLSGRSQALTAPASNPIRGMIQKSESSKVLYFGDTTKLWRWIDDGSTTAEDVGQTYALIDGAGATEWDSGSTTWDSGDTTWDFGVNEAGQWSMIDFGTWVLATPGPSDPPQIKKDNVNFVDLQDGVTRVSIDAGGTGYSVSDALTFTGGGGSGAAAVVNAIGGGGEITQIKLTASGSDYTSVPAVSETSAGTGATFTAFISNLDKTEIEIFIKSGPHVLGFHTNSDGREFVWCSADDPDDWIAIATNTAGSLLIREFDTDINCVVSLGDSIAVYSDNKMALVTFLGAPFVFGYTMALDTVGAVSKHSVVAVGRKNYGLSRRGFFVTDGVNVDYIDNPPLREHFLANSSDNDLAKAVAYHDKDNQAVKWYYPTATGENDGGLMYNYQTDTWAVLTKGLTAVQENRVFINPVSGDSDGKIFLEGALLSDDGTTNNPSVASTKWFDLGDPARIKEIDSIRMGFTGEGLQITPRIAEIMHGSFTSLPVIRPDTTNVPIYIRTAARYIGFDITGFGLTADWELQSLEITGRFSGEQ